MLVFVQLLNYVLNPHFPYPPTIWRSGRRPKALIRKLAGAIATNVRQEGTVEKHTLTSGIVLEDLSFAYEADKPVLEGINFTFQAGKRYAIVGASGSGKSTLLHLLMAAYPGYQGGIYLDGTELREINSEALYEIISVVQQNVFIFNASIRDNITMFASFPKAEVDRAIALSGLSKLIEERGEDYRCGENGSGLSGGGTAADFHCPEPAEKGPGAAGGRGHRRLGRPDGVSGVQRHFGPAGADQHCGDPQPGRGAAEAVRLHPDIEKR